MYEFCCLQQNEGYAIRVVSRSSYKERKGNALASGAIRFRQGPGRKMRTEKAQRGRRKRFPGRAVPAVRMRPVRRSV